MQYLFFLRIVLILFAMCFASGCMNMTAPSSSNKPSNMVDRQSASGVAGKAGSAGAVFSDLNELDYSYKSGPYKIGVSDLLDIKVFQAEELSQELRVDPQGNIVLPLIGVIAAAGEDQFSLAKKIAKPLGEKYLQNPQVTVSVKEFTNQRVTVEGEVKSAGVFPLEGAVTAMQAVALAGGLESSADASKVVLFRKTGDQTKAYNLDLNAIRTGEKRDPYIKNDDRIIVHRSDSRFWLREVGSLLYPFRVLMAI